MRDTHHFGRSFAAEQHQAREKVRPKPQPHPFGGAIDLERLVEFRVKDHPRGLQNAIDGHPELARLTRCPLRATDHILILAFDPEMRRVIGNVGYQRDERSARPTAIQRFFERAIVMRDQRDDHVRLRLGPIGFQHAYL